MNLSEFPITTAVWVLAIMGKVALLTVILLRNFRSKYPWFTAFVAASLAISVTRFICAGLFPWFYLRVYYGTKLVSVILLTLTITEVYRQAFTFARSVFVTWWSTSVRLIGSGVTLVALFSLLLPSYTGRPLGAVVYMSLDRASTLLALFAYGTIALLSSYLGLVWGQKLYGMAVGFLFYLSVDVVCAFLVSTFPSFATPSLNVISILAFIGSECVWMVHFIRKDAALNAVTHEQIETAKKAVQSARSIIRRERTA